MPKVKCELCGKFISKNIKHTCSPKKPREKRKYIQRKERKTTRSLIRNNCVDCGREFYSLSIQTKRCCDCQTKFDRKKNVHKKDN